MVEKKVLKSDLDRRREEVAAALQRDFAAMGDTRSLDEIYADIVERTTPTPERVAIKMKVLLAEPEILVVPGEYGVEVLRRSDRVERLLSSKESIWKWPR